MLELPAPCHCGHTRRRCFSCAFDSRVAMDGTVQRGTLIAQVAGPVLVGTNAASPCEQPDVVDGELLDACEGWAWSRMSCASTRSVNAGTQPPSRIRLVRTPGKLGLATQLPPPAVPLGALLRGGGQQRLLDRIGCDSPSLGATCKRCVAHGISCSGWGDMVGRVDVAAVRVGWSGKPSVDVVRIGGRFSA